MFPACIAGWPCREARCGRRRGVCQWSHPVNESAARRQVPARTTARSGNCALGEWGSPPQRGGPLAELLSGEAVGAWAHETAGGPAGGGAGRVTAVYSGGQGQSGGQVVLNGGAGCVEGAAGAKYLLVTAVGSGGGRSRYLVPVDAAGVELAPLGGLDLTRRFSGVTFRDVTLPAAARVGAAGNADARPMPADAPVTRTRAPASPFVSSCPLLLSWLPARSAAVRPPGRVAVGAVAHP